jgi:hypothetical protein
MQAQVNYILHMKNTLGTALLTVALLKLTCVPAHAQPTGDQAAGTKQEFAVTAPDLVEIIPQLSENAQLGAISIRPLAVSLVLFNPKFIKLK